MAVASCSETGGLASFAINLQFDRKRRNIRNRVNGGRSSELGNRLFVEAVIWKFRSGAPWRDLPERFGDWKNIHKRFSRWAASGVWESLFKTLASIAPGPVKRGLRPSHRPLARRPYDENPRDRRRPWQSTGAQPHWWQRSRHHASG